MVQIRIYINESRQVLRFHADFSSRMDMDPLDIEDYTDPTFRVLRANVKRTVLILDDSGSMGFAGGNSGRKKIELLNQVSYPLKITQNHKRKKC